jgi:hypothetical protein
MTTELQTLNQELVTLDLFKAAPASEDADAPWKFQGIASDESPDVVGDALLKSILDISYAQERGYVNWDHKADPANILGFLSQIRIIEGESEIKDLSKSLGREISPTASVYVEGELYKSVARASEVYNILQSAPPTHPGLGISLEGGIQRYKDSGLPARAIVRGVAITAVPTHPKTMVTLRKALSEQLGETRQEGGAMTFDQAVLWVLQQRPTWTYSLAKSFVSYTIAQGATS